MASRVTSGDASGLLSLVLTLLHAFPVSVHHHTHWLPGRPPWALVSVTSQLAKAGLIAKGPLAHSSDSGLPAPGSQRPGFSPGAAMQALCAMCHVPWIEPWRWDCALEWGARWGWGRMA